MLCAQLQEPSDNEKEKKNCTNNRAINGLAS